MLAKTMLEPILDIRSLSFKYDNGQVLQEVNNV